MKRLGRPLSLALVCWAVMLPHTRADGCYMPERAVRKIPSIPTQRALIAWRDGLETLIVSSALDSEAQTVGWILPLPSVPETIERVEPGALKTLTFCLQPNIVHDLSRLLTHVFVFGFAALLILLVALFAPGRLGGALVGLLMLGILFALALPAVRRAGAAAARRPVSVHPLKMMTVGSYEIAILRPWEADDLKRWLQDNGLAALPAEAETIVERYVGSDWVFAVIRLTRDRSGVNAPHPLKAVFKSPSPVYPLRLTAIAGGAPFFELFVAGEQRAATELLSTEFCDRYRYAPARTYVSVRGEQQREILDGETYRLAVGHPELLAALWENAVLTKLTGSIRASEMQRDLVFDWERFRPKRRRFFTVQGALQLATLVFAGSLGLFVAVSLVLLRDKLRGARVAGTWYCSRLLGPAVLVCLAAAATVYAGLARLDSSGVTVSRGRLYDSLLQTEKVLVTEAFLKDNPEILARSAKKIGMDLKRHLAEPGSGGHDRLRTSGIAVELEASPGNLTVHKTATNVVVRLYDSIGTPVELSYPIE